MTKVVHFPDEITAEDVFACFERVYPLPAVNSGQFLEAAPGTVRLAKIAKPICRGGYWELRYEFEFLPPMIGEGI
jgi:hypothetical protein